MDLSSLPRRAKLADCDQGDFVVDDTAFLALTDDPNNAEAPPVLEVVAAPIVGLTVITQICDLQPRTGREYVKVASLIDRSAPEYEGENKRVGDDYDPRYASIENLPDGFFVDLDHVMIVSKSWLEKQDIIVGFQDPVMKRSFQRQLGRNLSRFGFPDSFNIAMSKISDRIRKTRRKPSGEVGLLAAKVKEILVYCDRDWADERGNVRFVLIINEDYIVDMEEVETEFAAILAKHFDDAVSDYKLDVREGAIDVVAETEETISLFHYRKGRRLDLGFVSYHTDDPEIEL